MFFTVEETNLMCCFDTSSRKRLIAEMKSLPINELDDEMAEPAFSYRSEALRVSPTRRLPVLLHRAGQHDGRLKGGCLCPYWMAVLKLS